MLTQIKQLVISKSSRPEKGGDLSTLGWFPAPPAPEPRAAHFPQPFLRRAVAGRTARLQQRFAKILWKLASRTFKISSNILIEGQPTGILRFFRRFLVWNFQAAKSGLPPGKTVGDFGHKIAIS